jgi:hypothetical protein
MKTPAYKAHYQKTFGGMVVAIGLAAAAAFGTNNWAANETERYNQQTTALAKADTDAQQAANALKAIEQAMRPVQDFMRAWEPYLRPFPRETNFAEAVRSAMDAEAQRKLNLLVDASETPAPSKYTFGGRTFQVQKVTRRANGENLVALLTWLGLVEELFPYARVDKCEVSVGTGRNSALLVTLTFPLVSTQLQPANARPAATTPVNP